MKIEQFFEHHGVSGNPFAEEDAQTDPVFKEHCIATTHHPSWGKVFGDPTEPATSVVFGEKGSGKTAIRLQIARDLREYNRANPERRVFVIQYDDFNPFLDRFKDRLGMRRSKHPLEHWKLWDHMDAILSLGVTQLLDQALGGPVDMAEPVALEQLDRHQSRDLLLLAACYDQSLREPFVARWRRLKRRLRYRAWKAKRFGALAWLVTLGVAGTLIGLQKWEWLETPWPYVFVALGWVPYLLRWLKWHFVAGKIVRQARVVKHTVGPLRRVLLRMSADDLVNQPLPNKERTDDRYELLQKFQGVLRTLGYTGIVVLVDRVDEPHLINGNPEQMRSLLWPMLDNKFLKHPGIGYKLLLPIELSYFIDREDRDFYQRARLDKQNMIPSLEWTGEALYDVANARLAACALAGRSPKLRELFDPAITDRRLIDALRSLRVPRHLFKFMYRVLTAHCNAFTEDRPVWQISAESFESTLALYLRDQDAFERGMGAG
ncbi:MAG: hypothetical protein JNG90_07355 [Planctomycetaceae bacterium]|nr:hypothetical protein [Planctomycetaceae bacterium]